MIYYLFVQKSLFEEGKHLLRYCPILARSSTLNFDGVVKTRQTSQYILTWSILSFQTGHEEVYKEFISTLNCT